MDNPGPLGYERLFIKQRTRIVELETEVERLQLRDATIRIAVDSAKRTSHPSSPVLTALLSALDKVYGKDAKEETK